MVNPEYSIPETVAVFGSSMHFFTKHTGLWWIDFIFSVLVLGVLFSFREVRRRAWEHRHAGLAVGAVILMFTEVTHAFQNARYYYFFLPFLAAITPQAALFPVAALGVLHVLAKMAEPAVL